MTTKLPRAGRPPKVTEGKDGALYVDVYGNSHKFRVVGDDTRIAAHLRRVGGSGTDPEYARTVVERHLGL